MTPFLSHTAKLEGLAHELATAAECRSIRTYSPSGAASLDIVRTEILHPCCVSEEYLVENLLQNGFQYIDPEYLRQGYIRAKFDTEFDIWADSREPLEPHVPLTVDFSGDFVISDDLVDDADLTETMEAFLARLSDAVECFDAALRDRRDDLQHIFGPVAIPQDFPWPAPHEHHASKYWNPL
jgi:hypothetical protein